jgi:hypothetical protein
VTASHWRVAALAVATYVAVFRLPFLFPPRRLLVSPSYAFGFNNSVAVLALTALLLVATLHRLFRRDGSVEDPGLGFPDGGAPAPRPGAGLFAAMAGVYAALTALMYAYARNAATPWITWESRHFLHRIKLIETYGLRPYADVQVEYGPALMYPPMVVHRLLAPLGVSIEGAYFLSHFLLNVAGLWCLWHLARHAAAPARAKTSAFVIVGLAGFAPYMGLNGVVLRYACPFAAVLLGHRLWIAWRAGLSPLRAAALTLAVAALAATNVVLSPEIAVAFALGWLAYAILWLRTDRRLAAVSVLALAGTAVASWLVLPPEYYRSLMRFSQGANNLPMVPAAHLVLYVVTLVLIVPPLLAAGWRGGRSDAALLGAFGTLSVVLMPGALGRCDPPHVLFFGLVVSLLAMLRSANVSRRSHGAYLLAYVAVFIGFMHLVNLVNFFGVDPKELVLRPASAIRAFVAAQRAQFASRDLAYLRALDAYPAIGLPFATWGFDDDAEKYLFATRRVDPEFYVGVVAVYTEADIARKLADTGRHEYLLVDRKWDRPAVVPLGERHLASLRRWFLYPARLQPLRKDLDSMAVVENFIRAHYRAVETVGSSVVVRRIAAPGEPPGER